MIVTKDRHVFIVQATEQNMCFKTSAVVVYSFQK